MLSAHAQFARRVRGDGWHSLLGTPLYYTGTLGVVQIPSGAVVLQISVQSTSGGSFTLFGGAPIPIPASIYPLEFVFQHTLWQSNPQNIGLIVFTGTTHFFVHAVQEGNTPVASVPFLPPQVGNLVSWLRADMGITLNGSNVSAWADQSGNGNHVTQATAVKQPTYVASDASYNGLPTVSFGGAQSMNTAALLPSSPIAQPITMILAGQTHQSPGGSFLCEFSGTRFLFYYTTIGPDLRVFANGSELLDNVNVADQKHVYAAQFNGAASALYIDNSQTAAASGTVGAGSLTDLAVGSESGTANFLTGKIAEVIVYNSVISPIQRSTLFAYLGSRYGIVTS